MKKLLSNFLKDIIRDTDGFAITAFLLLLIPLSFILNISINETSNLSRVADKTINYSVTNAVKSAALMVDPESQAQGEPHIAYNRARTEFLESLIYNLSLTVQGVGDTKSSISDTNKIKYWLLIYNGDDNYEGYTEEYKVVSYAFSTNENEITETYETNTITGFPKTVYVGDDGITDTAGEGKKAVTLKERGVLAVVQANVRSITQNEEVTVTRWAYGKIVKK